MTNVSKGQTEPKAVWANCRSSKKTNERICFVCHEKQKNKKTKKNQFVHSLFGRVYGATICFWFHLTFTIPNQNLEIKSLLRGLILFRSIFNFSRQKSRLCRIFISISKKLSQKLLNNILLFHISYKCVYFIALIEILSRLKFSKTYILENI